MDAGSHDVQGSSVVLGGVDQSSLEKSRSSVVWSVVESVIVEAATAIRKTEEDLKASSGELGSNKAVGEEGVERLNDKEACEPHSSSSEVSSHVELGTSKNSNKLAHGNVSETVIVIVSGEASRGAGDDGRMGVKGEGDELGSSKVDESKMKVPEAVMDSHVINIKCRSGKSFGDNWDVESVCRICHLSSEQSPDRKLESSSGSITMDLIPLGCGCKDELGVAHAHCAEAWFRLKGNRICEICGETAKNVTGLGDNRFLEEWNERRFSGLGENISERNVGCWRGQPFCNFLMACLEHLSNLGLASTVSAPRFTSQKTKTLYCKGRILKFGCDGWWYRACPVENCYRQCFKKEENGDKYSCNTHEPGTPIPTYRVGVILEDEFSDITVTLMGNIAEQFFGYQLDVLRNKRVYISEQVLPPEITITAGQVRTFEVKGNTHGNWKVISFSPPEETPTVTIHAPEVSEKQTSTSSTIIPPLTLQTPEKSVGGKQKRGVDLISPALHGSPSKNKPRRNEKDDAASSSPNITERYNLD